VRVHRHRHGGNPKTPQRQVAERALDGIRKKDDYILADTRSDKMTIHFSRQL
jgi:hypothetical protein